MRNADMPTMPTMPVSNGDNEPANMQLEYYRNKHFATGLTKREAMAMAAMQGLCTNVGYHTHEALAKDAVACADALLAALEEKK